MKVEEIFFRDMYRQICLLTGAGVVELVNLHSLFDFPPDEKLDGFLTYAYVDGETFAFEILAGAKTLGGRAKMFPVAYKKIVKLKRAQVDDAEIKIVTDDYALPFRDRIEMIHDRTDAEPVREETRLIKNLDAFRHPHYPDDVVVYFFSEADKPAELLWVRCAGVDENILTGELLNEPHKNFGIHAGDKIKFGVVQINEQNILLYLPSKEDSLA